MINTDFPTTYAKNYILDVVYSINYASKVGRIAKPFADTKFSTAFLNEYAATYGFDTIEKATECKNALEKAFKDIKGVDIGNVRDRYMERVEREIENIEKEAI